MKVLANDGISKSGEAKLIENGFEVSTQNIPQNELIEAINKKQYSVLLVRSATKVRKDLIDACPNLKMIGRGGVGMDNIDVEYAREKGIHVFNTPASSSIAVAELAMGHLFSMARGLYDANRKMTVSGHTDFKVLKKKYAKGTELRGKTLGIIGFGRIGKALASYAMGCGMNVVFSSINPKTQTVNIVLNNQNFPVTLESISQKELLEQSDFISIHTPMQKNGQAVISKTEFEQMTKQPHIVNTARGGVIDEKDMIWALENRLIKSIALDVFTNEPTPDVALLQHENISLSPHIGAATMEAQDRIGEELAQQIIDFLKN